MVVGGGAAGFFSSLAAKEAHPAAEVILIEKSAKLLSKVRISGGGRCNVTHSCFDPRLLVQNYPRGQRELLGPFHRFQPEDTLAWFEARGVPLKREGDGRIFPKSNSSETIIRCLMEEANRLKVKVWTRTRLTEITPVDSGFELAILGQEPLVADRLILATGSSPQGWSWAQSLGHSVQAPVPSLFTFNVPQFPLVSLSGVAVEKARLKLEGFAKEMEGPLLVTHWGWSGPAALKLSAWAARFLAEKGYQASLKVDWIPDFSADQVKEQLERECQAHPSKQLASLRLFSLPKKLWRALCERGGLDPTLSLNGLGKVKRKALVDQLKGDRYDVKGKTTNKEEFVTCGGVTLSEVNFKTMESRLCPHLFFCGEILDIDGVTGGFNFQNAWTTGWLAGRAAGDSSS